MTILIDLVRLILRRLHPPHGSCQSARTWEPLRTAPLARGHALRTAAWPMALLAQCFTKELRIPGYLAQELPFTLGARRRAWNLIRPQTTNTAG